MEFVKGKLYVTADVDADIVMSMHIDRWYKPGLPCEYYGKHITYNENDPPEKRKHVVKVFLSEGGSPMSFWVYECVIQERCVWDYV